MMLISSNDKVVVALARFFVLMTTCLTFASAEKWADDLLEDTSGANKRHYLPSSLAQSSAGVNQEELFTKHTWDTANDPHGFLYEMGYYRSQLWPFPNGYLPANFNDSYEQDIATQSSWSHHAPVTKWYADECKTLGLQLVPLQKIHNGRNKVFLMHGVVKKADFEPSASSQTPLPDSANYAVKVFNGPSEYTSELMFFTQTKGMRLIVDAVCTTTIDGKPAIVFEHVNGLNANDHIRAHPEVTHQEIRKMTAQLIAAIRYIHWLGWAHTDLKSENVVVRQSDGEIRVIDFGFALKMPMKLRRRGTQTTIAPEVSGALPDRPINEALDWWAVGVIVGGWHNIALARDMALSQGHNLSTEEFRGRDYAPVILAKKISKLRSSKAIKYLYSEPNEHLDIDTRQLLMVLLEPEPSRRTFNTFAQLSGLKSLPYFEGVDWSRIPEPYLDE